MKVTKDDLKGEVARLTVDILQKMCEHQVEQGNEFDPTVFWGRRGEAKDDGGIDWNKTDEGYEFWYKVVNGNIDLFYERYPKQPETLTTTSGLTVYKQDKMMLVSHIDDKNKGIKRVVFGEKNGKYCAWASAYTYEKAAQATGVCRWKYAWEIEEKKKRKMTVAEICEALGEEIEIVKEK